jgi:hypothetical protein
MSQSRSLPEGLDRGAPLQESNVGAEVVNRSDRLRQHAKLRTNAMLVKRHGRKPGTQYVTKPNRFPSSANASLLCLALITIASIVPRMTHTLSTQSPVANVREDILESSDSDFDPRETANGDAME